jgi:hypothetical protein
MLSLIHADCAGCDRTAFVACAMDAPVIPLVVPKGAEVVAMA